MSEHTFEPTAGIIFLLIALAHLARILFSARVLVQGVAVPMWVSAIAVVLMGYLSYEGFHFARTLRRRG